MHVSTTSKPARAYRPQRYLNFQLQVSDKELLHQLKSEHREILLCEGSYLERAQKLNIAPGTVRSRLHRARVALEALRPGPPVTDDRITQLN